MKSIEITEELKSHFLRLYSMAISDDSFHRLELKMLYEFARKRGVSEKDLKELLLNPTEVITKIPDALEDKITCLYELSQMIWADSRIEENERATLIKYIRLFGFEEKNIFDLTEYLLTSAQEEKDSYTVLMNYKTQNNV